MDKKSKSENASTESIEALGCWSVDVLKILTLGFPFALVAYNVSVNILACRSDKISLAEVFTANLPTHPCNRCRHAVPRTGTMTVATLGILRATRHFDEARLDFRRGFVILDGVRLFHTDFTIKHRSRFTFREILDDRRSCRRYC